MAYALTREVELAVLEETAGAAGYGISPGSPAGADIFKHTSKLHITNNRGKYFRDQDGDYQQASVNSVQKGRESSSLKIDCDAIPSANSATPTEPDIDLLLKHHFGQKHKATAHTTTAAGSAGVSLVLTGGGGAASGILANDLIAVDYAGTGLYEVRRVISIATDTVTLDRAFTSDPAAGRAVKVGTTYRFLNTYNQSLYLWQWIAANTLRHAVPGVILPNFEMKIGFASDAPRLPISFSGMGKKEITHAISRPTPVVAGTPLVPELGYIWFGAGASPTKGRCVNFSVKSNNGFKLREVESNFLEPSGIKRTDNNARYNVSAELEMLLSTSTDPAVDTLYDSAKNTDSAPFNVLAQFGNTVGKMVAVCLPAFVCDPERTEIDGEYGAKFSGRAIGPNNDDEIFLGWI